MARISFRQGIVSHQTDTAGNPLFLNINGAYVDLVVSPDPTVIAMIHGTADYLFTEANNTPQAWGPLPSVTSWLYWDLDLIEGTISRGFTTLEPIMSSTKPNNPTTGQMWFDTTANIWYAYNGAVFLEVVRVFAAEYTNAVTLTSMSTDAPKFTGSQIITTDLSHKSRTRAGALVFGKNLQPLKNPNTNTFFTTEDEIVTGVPTSASLRINNQVVTGRVRYPIAAYTVVQYDDFNSIVVANPALEGVRLFGIIEEDAITDEIVSFVLEGIIFNEQWDWIEEGASINSPLYINNTGQISLSNSSASSSPIGFVFSRQEIFFAPRLFVSVTVETGGAGSGLTTAQLAQLNAATQLSQTNQSTLSPLISTTIPNLVTSVEEANDAASAAEAAALAAVDNANSRVLKTGDALTGKLTSPLTLSADADNVLTTKGYVDGATIGFQTTFIPNTWVGVDERVILIPASVHQLPLNRLYHVTVFDTNLNAVVDVAITMNIATGLVQLSTNGPAFAGIVRIT